LIPELDAKCFAAMDSRRSIHLAGDPSSPSNYEETDNENVPNNGYRLNVASHRLVRWSRGIRREIV
jgi:hypothetical protein